MNRVQLSVSATMLPALLLATLLGLAAQTQAQSTYYDRNEIPGDYTIGLYTDSQGSSNTLVLDKDQDRFDMFIGITGDSTQIYSAVVFGIDLPAGIEVAGPIHWRPLEGLTQKGVLTDEGVQVEFNRSCVRQTEGLPAIIGRISMKLNVRFTDSEVIVREARPFGLSVELCDDSRGWPKPFAQPIHLSVSRQQSLWDKIRGWFS